jgi:hypothetical protein
VGQQGKSNGEGVGQQGKSNGEEVGQQGKSRSDVTRGLPDLGKSFILLVCVCFLTSRLTVQNSSSPSDVQ